MGKDARFINVTIDVLHTGGNLNGSRFEKEVVDRAAKSIANTPILGYIEQNDDDELDFKGHEHELIVDEDGIRYVYAGSAYGVIPESCNPRWVSRDDGTGKTREYLRVDGLLWTKFDDSCGIFERDVVKGQSMEITNMEGYVDKDGKNLELDFVYYSGRAELPLFAEATQSDAKKVGIKVNMKNVDYNVLYGIGTRGEYDLLISNILTEPAGDPEVFLNMYWKTNVNGSNPGYSNPEYDALSDQLASEFDPAKRRDIIIKMEKIIQDDAATLVFGYPQTNMVSNKTVEHADIKPCDYYWITKDITPAK